jgi:hypothetical protein
MSPKLSISTNSRASSSRYLLSLFFTAAGLILLAWAGGQVALWVCNVGDAPIDPGVVVLEAIAGGMTSVFGFLMLVQASPSIDTEPTCAWSLPDQRIFADDVRTDIDTSTS